MRLHERKSNIDDATCQKISERHKSRKIISKIDSTKKKHAGLSDANRLSSL